MSGSVRFQIALFLFIACCIVCVTRFGVAALIKEQKYMYFYTILLYNTYSA